MAERVQPIAAIQYQPGDALPPDLLPVAALYYADIAQVPPDLVIVAGNPYQPGDVIPADLRRVAAIRYKRGDAIPGDLRRVAIIPHQVIAWDYFRRGDDATTLGIAASGHPWTAHAGTWGVSSGRAYSASDTNGDLVTLDAGRGTGVVVQVIAQGQLVAANHRRPCVVVNFRDTSTYLALVLMAGSITLTKTDGGVTTDLASGAGSFAAGTDYTLRVAREGDIVRCSVDGVKLITYTLTGAETAYGGYTRHGLLLDKAGTPSFDARWDAFRVALL